MISIVGYIGYGLLILVALTWTVGVRVMLGIPITVIFGALFFVAASAALPVLGASLLHSWWLIPTGFLLVWLASVVVGWGVPVVSHLILLLSSAFASLVRVGIPQAKIQQALLRADAEGVERWARSRKE